METSPKDYVDTLDSDNSLEFDNSMDFEELWNYYVYANSKDSKDAPKIPRDYELCKSRKDLDMRCQNQQFYGWANYEESEENKVTFNNNKVYKKIHIPLKYLHTYQLYLYQVDTKLDRIMKVNIIKGIFCTYFVTLHRAY